MSVFFLKKLAQTFFSEELKLSKSAEVVVWPAASNDRRLVAVCSACHKAVRSGFTAQAVSGPYNHHCAPAKSHHSAR